MNERVGRQNGPFARRHQQAETVYTYFQGRGRRPSNRSQTLRSDWLFAVDAKAASALGYTVECRAQLRTNDAFRLRLWLAISRPPIW